MADQTPDTPTKDPEDVTERDTDGKPRRPKRFFVTFVNDDFTPFSFVNAVLVDIFKMSNDAAQALSHEIHTTGRGRAGPYTLEIAETRATQAMLAAQRHEFPFRCAPEAE